MAPYLVSALIATVMLISLYVLSLRQYPVALKFDLPNHLAEYQVPTKPLDSLQPISLSLTFKTTLTLGGICIFEAGGYTFDLRVQNAKVVLLFKVTSSNLIKLTLESNLRAYEGWNYLYVICTTESNTFKVKLNLNNDVTTGTVQDVKGLPFTPNKVIFGHLNFKGCLKDLYFNDVMVYDSNLNLSNVFKGCS